ncbi:hypothetical protein [Clostridium sp. 'White wine YQ']|uniref:hypothetical protein n=1 Tax=Clostridium sp. 'White wine YQ' TaxID=3027474 RepID=UPI002365F262|nr:hypothetical protein [Clostridium sp. 'White wine YQ']MDD7795010.1 hypothetical protein [Clostridium sp. 'White wine YQ']
MYYVKIFPNVYVVNSTNEALKDIHLTLEGVEGLDIRIKKISKNMMEAKAITTTKAKTHKSLFMYHFDNNNLKHEYLISDSIIWGDNRDIKIDILDINEDGTYKIIVDKGFVLK